MENTQNITLTEKNHPEITKTKVIIGWLAVAGCLALAFILPFPMNWGAVIIGILIAGYLSKF